MTPTRLGVKVIPRVQESPASRPGLFPHGLVPAGTALKSPLTVNGSRDTPERSRLLLTVITFGALVVPTACGSNCNWLGVNITSGDTFVERLITCGLVMSLSTMVTAPEAFIGKVVAPPGGPIATVIWHLPPGGSMPPQVVD